eukprot:CAMPEP_0184685178 /NCGR_PEP_ID=MMETSP0312-20130426/17989_1 /TAXON_ID=31354 /ORGANISM="Compsopogon coeruleus, Strain SAG 36.94" /LENGTH=38 /DNA_ID= /DNA_START= /DNA_END= /DNA_ORIENTATION=
MRNHVEEGYDWQESSTPRHCWNKFAVEKAITRKPMVLE